MILQLLRGEFYVSVDTLLNSILKTADFNETKIKNLILKFVKVMVNYIDFV